MASPVPSSPDSDPYAERRAFPRAPVALPAFLLVDGERHSVQLLDVSAGGAKLNCTRSVATGTAVIVDCGTLRRGAVVRWQTDGLLGLCFDSELDGREVSALVERSTALAARRETRA